MCLEGKAGVALEEKTQKYKLRGTSFVPGIVLGALYTASHDHSQYLKLCYVKY